MSGGSAVTFVWLDFYKECKTKLYDCINPHYKKNVKFVIHRIVLKIQSHVAAHTVLDMDCLCCRTWRWRHGRSCWRQALFGPLSSVRSVMTGDSIQWSQTYPSTWATSCTSRSLRFINIFGFLKFSLLGYIFSYTSNHESKMENSNLFVPLFWSFFRNNYVLKQLIF